MKNITRIKKELRARGRMLSKDSLSAALAGQEAFPINDDKVVYADDIVDKIEHFLKAKPKKPVQLPLNIESPEVPVTSQLDRIESMLSEVISHLSISMKIVD